MPTMLSYSAQTARTTRAAPSICRYVWRSKGAGEGANYTRRRLPVELVYVEEFERIDQAFIREKQVQNWSRANKRALIAGECNQLPRLAKKVNWRRG